MDNVIQLVESGERTGKNEMLIEQGLEKLGNQAVFYAKSLSIKTNDDYEDAGRFLTEIKTRMKSVKDYWAEPKAKAKAAHQSVVDREKALLAPLTEAENIIKRSMVVYQNAVAEAQRKAAEEARKRQREEAARLMQEAIAHEEKGNDAAAYVSMAMAEMVEDMKAPMPNAVEAPKASGISTRKVWKARVVDASKVPIYANGVEIRPIDFQALNRLASVSKGSLEIPGVECYEESIVSARSW